MYDQVVESCDCVDEETEGSDARVQGEERIKQVLHIHCFCQVWHKVLFSAVIVCVCLSSGKVAKPLLSHSDWEGEVSWEVFLECDGLCIYCQLTAAIVSIQLLLFWRREITPEERHRAEVHMMEGFQSMMDRYSKQKRQLMNREPWVASNKKHGVPPSAMTITHVNQTKDLFVCCVKCSLIFFYITATSMYIYGVQSTGQQTNWATVNQATNQPGDNQLVDTFRSTGRQCPQLSHCDIDHCIALSVQRIHSFIYLFSADCTHYWYSVASVCHRLSVTLCIVAKRCVLEHKLLLRAYRQYCHWYTMIT